ncbi:MAG: DUF1592 domain-containing protein, partial [Acidobacteria bacterium]|nr:DUF1592 domain-containing protein [Acidobacteriota bacterium]
VLMEKYLAAAEKIARAAIAADPPPKATRERYKADTARQLPVFEGKHRFPAEGEYELQAGLGGLRPDGAAPIEMAVWLDGEQVKLFDVDPGRGKPRTFDFRLSIKAGEHKVRVAFLNDLFTPDGNAIAPRDRYLGIEYLEIRGPFNPLPPPLPEGHKRILICGHASGAHQPECARKIVGELARRAYRRPVTVEEVDRLARFVELAQQEGDSFEQGIRVALQAVLVSPHFLFRIERDPLPTDPAAAHRISEFELASRLSYFLWSSMPDEELFRAARDQRLRKPVVLEAQVRRMLAGPKSRAIVENFAGQWLELRNLDTVKPDKDRFPAFDEELRAAMRTETQMFFESIVREDRSILDFLDAKYTFVNERLARHYGISGVQGSQFRRVALQDGQRGGVITQASVLTVSSYANRTSPVVRGKWLLENILGTPPPLPPPDVPNLKEESIGSTASLRKQLEQHRAQASCAVCHDRIDPLGFGLENYDAIGAWRTMDGKFPVDSTGTLPNGKSFQGPAGLKEILKGDKDSFARCLTEKMLTYALGRGLERYDQPAVASIVRRLAPSDYRFSRLVIEIVNSMPFEMRRGDGGKT